MNFEYLGFISLLRTTNPYPKAQTQKEFVSQIYHFFSLSVLFVCHSNNIFHKLTEMGSPEKSLRFNVFLFTSKTTLKFRERFIKFDEIFQLFWRLLMCGSCHIRSVVIGIEYRYWHRTLDVYIPFCYSAIY